MRPAAATETSIRAARPEDLPAVLALLEAAALPTVEVAEWLLQFVVAESDGGLIGAAGLETHGDDGVLRSVVVDGSRRGSGLGSRLTSAVIENARERGLRALYLLTTTAPDFFPRHGFRPIDRAHASADARRSIEFREACPASATVMVLDLGSD